MRIGITALFRGSAFSGSLPQVAVFLSRALVKLGHEVEFLIPQDSDDWFIDCSDVALIPRIKLENGAKIKTYHLLIEVVWFLPPDIREQIALKTAMFYHYPPVFYDIESSVYPLTTFNRNFKNVDFIWTWSHFLKTDISYLEILSRKPVFLVPFLWDPVFLTSYAGNRSCSNGDYEIAICESNQTNTSNCTLPLTILSEIYKNNPVKWRVLNAESLITNKFFVSNIVKNLHIDQNDISGNFCKRIRLPDLLSVPTVIISHQRWRPLKYMLLDALYLGIPLIHNCEMLKDISGGEYYYENRVGQAVKAWFAVNERSDYDIQEVRSLLDKRFTSDLSVLDKLVSTINNGEIVIKPKSKPIQLAFVDMWVDFQQSHNTIVAALTSRGIDFDINQESPNLIIFGPFGYEHKKWPGVRKIFYTGESLKPLLGDDIVLNIGFRRNVTMNYFRLPIWMTELNWFNNDVSNYKNPEPFPLDYFVKNTSGRSKFCAFVASNPSCVKRNTLFNIISRYKKVDSAGLLFSNTEIIEGGPGGSGGQHLKVNFYKKYKFVLACENESSYGYVTEKIVHAKLAGCVPIYWGDPLIDLEFNPSSFINVNRFSSVDDLLKRIKELDESEEKWLKISNEPLILNTDKFRDELHLLADTIAGCVNSTLNTTTSYEEFSKIIKPPARDPTEGLLSKISEYLVKPIENSEKEVIVTACNHKFIPCAAKLALSSSKPLYVWGLGLSPEDKSVLSRLKVTIIDFDLTWFPREWSDFWNTEHYAWKPLLLYICTKAFKKGTKVLYLDSGIEIMNDITRVWSIVEKEDVFVLEMPEHKMSNWSHPTFCSLMKMTDREMELSQYSANIVAFKIGGLADSLFIDCLIAACQKEIISGKKWHQYSKECPGHRHDQSILSLLGHRASLTPYLLDDFAGDDSYTKSKRDGMLFYVHRGLWKFAVPIVENIEEACVVNLEHRRDRLDKFHNAHPYISKKVHRVDAVYGNTLRLNRDHVKLFRNNDFKWKKGVIGCALSHYNIWLDLKNCAFSKSRLILEDDAVLDPNFLQKWRSIAHLMPEDADIVFLGGVLPPNKASLPSFTEPVNSAFAKVREITIGKEKRRFFHFCTYSYIIRKSGAIKLCKLIDEKGIFTSIDHMIVNHGSLLNIYFTTPLLATCFQDSDPNYQNADFNNFDRVDKFDSEIWNNVEYFKKEDIDAALRKTTQFIYFEEKQKDCIELQWLEEIFDSSICWVHFGSQIDPGSRVVVYYQHTTPVSIIEGWVNRHLDCSIVMFHASDESCTADVSIYKHSAIKTVFRNYWRPDCLSEKVIHLPLGYLNNTRGVDYGCSRKYTWSFAGAMDRSGRKEQLAALKAAVPNHKIHCTPTWNSSENLKTPEYVQMIQESRIVPCLAGFYNVESYRFYEALENGAIPIIPMDEKNSYTNIFNGSLNPPLLSITDMSKLGKVIGILEKNDKVLTVLAKDSCDWWYGYKIYLKKLIRSRIL